MNVPGKNKNSCHKHLITITNFDHYVLKISIFSFYFLNKVTLKND